MGKRVVFTGGSGKAGVDLGPAFHAASHTGDQDGRGEPSPKKGRTQIDLGEVKLRERAVQQAIPLQTRTARGGNGLTHDDPQVVLLALRMIITNRRRHRGLQSAEIRTIVLHVGVL